VILHNVIIESERKNSSMNGNLYNNQDPLADLDHHVPSDFLTMHAKIRDTDTHTQLQNDLVDHLWRLKGEAN
jgi:hypothetical protein